MSAQGRSSRKLRWVVAGALGLGAIWQLATVPSLTRQGIDSTITTSTLPLYVKALDFLHRHAHYQLLASAITRGCRSDEERALAVFAWTRQAIRRTPEDWPVIDDHILNIIIRGHGVTDQMADVFTTLATYAGLPAFWRQKDVALSFVQIDGRWRMFDVANGLIFTDADGRLADANDLFKDPALIQRTAGSLRIRGLPYDRCVARMGAFCVPPVLRARLQMPLPRLLFEAKRFLS